MNRFSVDDLQGVFAKLFLESWHGVVVGGQAVNLWAVRYADRIDILTGILGVSSSELLRTSVRWKAFGQDSGVEVCVIHPMLLMESKLACLRVLSQDGRQDEKHIRLLVAVIHAWLVEQLDEPRHMFRAIERIGALMMTPIGVHAFENGIELWDSIPLDSMGKLREYDLFFERRYEQIKRDIKSRRGD